MTNLRILLLTGICIASVYGSQDVNLTTHLVHLGTQRFLNGSFTKERFKAMVYIQDCFTQYGLTVHRQQYEVPAHPHNHQAIRRQRHEEAVNIIGYAGPLNVTGSDPLVVVGVAYDTDGHEDPIYNNGGGVAVLLEVARLFMSATNGQPHFPVVFVTFDLGTEICMAESGRVSGGWVFVQDWLLPRLSYHSYTLGMAIILGPLMNSKRKHHITKLPQQLQVSLSSLQDTAQTEENFLALLSYQASSTTSQNFKNFPGWLERVTLPPDIALNASCLLPIREARHFWSATRNNSLDSLPAFVITDLENLREKPETAEITKDNLRDAEVVVQGITSLLLTYEKDIPVYLVAAAALLVVTCLINLILLSICIFILYKH